MNKKRWAAAAAVLALAMLAAIPLAQTPCGKVPAPTAGAAAPRTAAQGTTTAFMSEPSAAVTPTAAATLPTPTAAPTPAASPARAVIASTGDLMCHLKNLKAGYDASSGTFDFTRFFRLVKPYLSRADFTLGNLETTLAQGEMLEDFSGFPLFKSPDAFAQALKDAGFDLLTCANNHMLDNGFAGLSRTLDVLDELSLYHTGSARTVQEAQAPLIVTIGGIRFGFLAYTYPINISRTPADMKKYALNLFDLDKARADIQASRDAGAEVVLVSLHWGPEENNTVPRAAYQKAVLKLLEAGADGILGHHPHVLQPMEWVEVTAEDGTARRCPVLYSQGNFHCNPATEGNAESCITYLTFEKDPQTGRVNCTDMAALPVYIYRIKTEPRDFVLIPIAPTLDNAEAYERLGLDNRKTLERGWEHILTSLGDQVRILRE